MSFCRRVERGRKRLDFGGNPDFLVDFGSFSRILWSLENWPKDDWILVTIKFNFVSGSRGSKS